MEAWRRAPARTACSRRASDRRRRRGGPPPATAPSPPPSPSRAIPPAGRGGFPPVSRVGQSARKRGGEGRARGNDGDGERSVLQRWHGPAAHQVHADAQPLVGLPQIEERPVGVVDARVGEREGAALRAEGSEDRGAVPAWVGRERVSRRSGVSTVAADLPVERYRGMRWCHTRRGSQRRMRASATW